MGISIQSKRKIVHDGIVYLWWTQADTDASGNRLSVRIASEDKLFWIKFFPYREEETEPYILMIGLRFPNSPKKRGYYTRLECPVFKSMISDESGITAQLVKEVLTWCLHSASIH